MRRDRKTEFVVLKYMALAMASLPISLFFYVVVVHPEGYRFYADRYGAWERWGDIICLSIAWLMVLYVTVRREPE